MKFELGYTWVRLGLILESIQNVALKLCVVKVSHLSYWCRGKVDKVSVDEVSVDEAS